MCFHLFILECIFFTEIPPQRRDKRWSISYFSALQLNGLIGIVHITLSGNPIACDCDNLWVMKVLLSPLSQVDDASQVVCGSGPLKGRVRFRVGANSRTQWNKSWSLFSYTLSPLDTTLVKPLCVNRRAKYNHNMVCTTVAGWFLKCTKKKYTKICRKHWNF